MVHLVLEDAGEQITAPHNDAAPPHVLALQLDSLSPTDLAVDARDAETAFDPPLRPRAATKMRIDDRQRAGPDVGDDDAHRNADLGSGQADPARPAHAEDHVGDELPDASIDHRHRSATLSKDGRIGMSERDDRAGAAADSVEPALRQPRRRSWAHRVNETSRDAGSTDGPMGRANPLGEHRRRATPGVMLVASRENSLPGLRRAAAGHRRAGRRAPVSGGTAAAPGFLSRSEIDADGGTARGARRGRFHVPGVIRIPLS